jgi:DNA-binding response OmpR family regulator
MRILILDDDPDICALLEAALTGKGHTVISHSDPTEFPLFNKQICPCKPEDFCTDVLIADIVMPKIKGIEFVKDLRNKGCWPLKLGNVAVMSGFLTLHYLNELHSMGIHYFRKPFELREIFNWLEKCQERVDLS